MVLTEHIAVVHKFVQGAGARKPKTGGLQMGEGKQQTCTTAQLKRLTNIPFAEAA